MSYAVSIFIRSWGKFVWPFLWFYSFLDSVLLLEALSEIGRVIQSGCRYHINSETFYQSFNIIIVPFSFYDKSRLFKALLSIESRGSLDQGIVIWIKVFHTDEIGSGLV